MRRTDGEGDGAAAAYQFALWRHARRYRRCRNGGGIDIEK